MPASVDVLALVGFVCESLFYGAYAVLFAASLWVLLWMRKTRRTNNLNIIFVLHCLLFVACTLHYALYFSHFVSYLNGGVVAGFANETYHTFIADCTTSVADFLGDLILIYRCYVLWSCNYYVAVLPLLTASSGLICAAVVGHLVWGTADATPSPSIVPLGLASFTLPLCTNVIVTSLIIFRIWYMSKDTVLYGLPTRSTTRAAMGIVIESGILYFVVQFIFVVIFGIGHPAEFIMILVATQTYGITSTLILINVGLGLSWEQTRRAQRSSLSWAPPSMGQGAASSSSLRTPTDVGGIEGSFGSGGIVELLDMRDDGKVKHQISASSLTSMPSYSIP
ncbi:uncharacterized protein PHACADRAFT_252254 [Phanerochaete carnosa HHB-10118-sp]|uniref:Uncharacterized protein n=1 Tax=Phanerochaete carnosa (strain HHB-10118-sp) TaxID=650164 RepID=K5WGD5_PHACS|nr:uncharacterized protein PHACADRAFT_252254 [Phanerochaete carnosa HHB-10118-sp]EKM58164.1 hypothetical protein PHACADRAFT_252254 [Phanerochaete carnosa HHB-10118-sp]